MRKGSPHNTKVRRGRFIVFEGIDGAGSTTQLQLLFEYLTKHKIKVIKTTNPSGSVIGKLIRDVLQKKFKVSRKAIQLLYCADRDTHLEQEVMPAITAGKIVLCDRYVPSTLAYGSLHLSPKWLEMITRDFLGADITFFIDTPARVAMERMKSRGKKEYFEKEEWLHKVSLNYLKLMKKDKKAVVLDGTRQKEEIFEEVLKVLKKKKYL